MTNEQYEKIALIFLRNGKLINGISGGHCICIGGVSFNWKPQETKIALNYEYFEGLDWRVSRVEVDDEYHMHICGDPETIQQDLDQVLTLGVLDGTFVQT